MFKNFIIPVFVLLFNTNLFSQSIVFNEIYDHNSDYQNGVAHLRELPSKNEFLILDTYYDYNNSNVGFVFIYVIDNFGIVQKNVSYKIPYGPNIGTSIVFEENYIYTTVVFVDSTEDYRFDALLLKLNYDLDSIYSKVIDVGYNNNGGTLTKISENKLMLISYYYADSSILENSQVVMVTIDTLGNILDQWEYGGAGYDFAYDFKVTPDGGYIIAGQTNNYVGDDNDFFMRKIDSLGNTDWYHEYGNANDETIRTWNYIELTNDGGYLMFGEELKSLSPLYKVSILLKVDSNGVQEYRKEISIIPKSTNAKSMRIRADNTIILTGGSYNSDTLYAPFSRPRGYLLKLSPDGQTEIWRRHYSKFWNGLDDYVHDMILTSDGGILSSGYILGVPGTNNDAWLVKFDSCGYTVGDIPKPMLVIDSIKKNTVYITEKSQNYCTAELDWGDGTENTVYYAYENNLPLQEKHFSHTYSSLDNYTIKTTALAGEEFRDYEVNIVGVGLENIPLRPLQRGNGLSLFPNPAKDYIIVQNYNSVVIPAQAGISYIDNEIPNQVRNDGFRMIIQNINGKTIKSITLDSRLYQQQINVSDLVNGVYFVSFTVNGEQIGIEKLVIAR